MLLSRRPHLGLDLALPVSGPGLVVMDLPDGSPLAGRVQAGARLMAIDGIDVEGLDHIRSLVRRLSVGRRCLLRFDSHELECDVRPLPLEMIPGSRVELGEVDCGDYRLRSVWTFPERTGPHPLVWLLPSGTWLSEEHGQEPWHPTLKLVRALAHLGFATLRVDRSGIGDSGGPPCTDADLETELAWWRAAHQMLIAEPRVDPSRWFLFGRSLGGIVAQLIGAELQPSALAVWGATSRPWHEAMMDNARRDAVLRGIAEPALSESLERRRRLCEAIYVGGETPAAVRARVPGLESTARRAYQGTSAHGRTVRFFQQLQAKDVAAACAEIEAPILVMRGELDWITGAQDAASVVSAARNPTFVRFPGIDHLMHRREDADVARRHIFGGDFDPAGAETMAMFFSGLGPT